MCFFQNEYRKIEKSHRFVYREGAPEGGPAPRCPVFDAAKERREAQEKLPQDSRQQVIFLAERLAFLQSVAVCQPENQAVHKLYMELWEKLQRAKEEIDGWKKDITPDYGRLGEATIDSEVALQNIDLYKSIGDMSRYLKTHPALGLADSSEEFEVLDNGNAIVILEMLFPENFAKSKLDDFETAPNVNLRLEIDRAGRIQSVNCWRVAFHGRPTVFAPFIGKRVQDIDMAAFRKAVREDAKDIFEGEMAGYAGFYADVNFEWEDDKSIYNLAQLEAQGELNDAEVYGKLLDDYYPLYPGERWRLRRVAFAYMKERGDQMNPIVKARCLIDIAASYLATAGEEKSQEYNPGKAFAYADQALKILQKDGIEKQMPKEFTDVTREGMILYCLYLRAHALKQEGKVDAKTVIRAYRRGLDMYRDAAKKKEKWVERSEDVFSNIANELVRVMLKNGQEKEVKALYDELVKENLDWEAYIGEAMAEHARDLAKKGKVREARALYPQDMSESMVDRFIGMEEWKKVLKPDERRARLKEFFQDKSDQTLERLAKKYPKLYKDLIDGKKTPWDFAPGSTYDTSRIDAYWSHIEGTLYYEDDPKKAQDHYMAALDGFIWRRDMARPERILEQSILRDLQAAVVREFIFEKGSPFKGTEQGEKVEFLEDETAEIDTEYLWVNMENGIAVEKYFRVELRSGVTVPTSAREFEVKEKGRILTIRANDYGRVEIQNPDDKEWYKVIDTSGINEPLYCSPFTKELTTKTPAEEMAEKIHFPSGDWKVWTESETLREDETTVVPLGFIKHKNSERDWDAKFYYFQGKFGIEEADGTKRESSKWPGFQQFFDKYEK